MKIIRKELLKAPGTLVIVFMALVFVLSISIHNHGIIKESEAANNISSSKPNTSHSIEYCSACLLQGNVKLPDTNNVFSSPEPLIVTTLEQIDFKIPSSSLNLYKPSRSPPLA